MHIFCPAEFFIKQGCFFFLLTNRLYSFQCYFLNTKPTNNKMTCAPSEDPDQPGHLPSLNRAFAVRMKKHWGLGYPYSAQQRLDQTSQMPRLIWVFAGRTSFCCFVGLRLISIIPLGHHISVTVYKYNLTFFPGTRVFPWGRVYWTVVGLDGIFPGISVYLGQLLSSIL